MEQEDIARRAFGRCKGLFPLEAVTDLVGQVFTHKFEPWMVLPGTKPRLREWGAGVARLTPKPTVLEVLDAGREAGEPLAVTLARVRRAYPRLTEEAMDAEISAYMAWLQDCAEKQNALARELTFEMMGARDGCRTFGGAADP